MREDLLLIRYQSLVFYHKQKYPVSKLKRLAIDEDFLDCAGQMIRDILLGYSYLENTTIPTIPTIIIST